MSPTHKRLGAAIDARIADLGWDYHEAADHAGISTETLAKARRGQKVSRKTLLRIEATLGWGEGSVDAILAGGDPRTTVRAIVHLPRWPGGPPIEENEPSIHLRGAAPLAEGEELLGWPAGDGKTYYRYTAQEDDGRPLVFRAPMSSDLSLGEVVRRVRTMVEIASM